MFQRCVTTKVTQKRGQEAKSDRPQETLSIMFMRSVIMIVVMKKVCFFLIWEGAERGGVPWLGRQENKIKGLNNFLRRRNLDNFQNFYAPPHLGPPPSSLPKSRNEVNVRSSVTKNTKKVFGEGRRGGRSIMKLTRYLKKQLNFSQWDGVLGVGRGVKKVESVFGSFHLGATLRPKIYFL